MTEDLLLNAPVGLVAFTLRGEVRAHNSMLSRWLGASVEQPDAFVGVNLVDHLSASGRLVYETQLIPRLLAGQSVRQAVLEVRNRHGDPHPVLLNAQMVEDASGERIVYAALMDAEGRIAYEQQLRETRRAADLARAQLAILQDATSRLAVASGLEDLGEALTAAAAQATQAPWVGVRIVGADPLDSTTDRWWGQMPAPTLAGTERRDRTEVLVCRDPAEISAAYPGDADLLTTAGVEALVVVPIVRVDEETRRAFGAIHCWFRRSRTLDAGIIETLQALGSQAERVIEHLTLQERVRHRALHDGLSGLPNRLLIEERLDQAVAAATRTGASCAVLFLDLDGFKAINDVLGHGVGDEVLREIAARLRETCRAGETVGRLGGDEFVVIVTGVDETGIRELADRIRHRVRLPLPGAASAHRLSASIGAALVQPHGFDGRITPAEVLSLADTAMYEAKRAGKDRTVIRRMRPEDVPGDPIPAEA